jgi:hypothetical protein
MANQPHKPNNGRHGYSCSPSRLTTCEIEPDPDHVYRIGSKETQTLAFDDGQFSDVEQNSDSLSHSDSEKELEYTSCEDQPKSTASDYSEDENMRFFEHYNQEA